MEYSVKCIKEKKELLQFEYELNVFANSGWQLAQIMPWQGLLLIIFQRVIK
jgi:hypothetical protein